MCLLLSNATADRGFATLKQSGDDKDYIARLVQHASEDSVDSAGGLHQLLQPLLSWQHDPELRRVRKVRIGRHRFYVTGQHTDCTYTICYIKIHKRAEENREEDSSFQSQILAALHGKVTHQLTEQAPGVTVPPIITLPAALMEQAFGRADIAARRTLERIIRDEIVAAYQTGIQPMPDARELEREVHIRLKDEEARYYDAQAPLN